MLDSFRNNALYGWTNGWTINPVVISLQQIKHICLERLHSSASSAHAYLPNTNEWKQLGRIPEGYYPRSAVVMGNIIYVSCKENKLLSYDPFLSQWIIQLNTYKYEPHQDVAILPWRGQVLLCGGRVVRGNANHISFIKKYNPRTDSSTLSEMKLPEPMSSHFMFPIGSE